MMHIKGENLNGVFSANEFLTRVNLMGAGRDANSITPLRIGKKVAVIGGGNVAMDAARTAVRVGFEEVSILYRRTEKELPARLEEIRHAKEEGVQFKFLHAPIEIFDKDGYVDGMKFEIMELGEPDASGRRRPVGTGKFVTEDVDTVIVALGTGPNPIIQNQQKLREWKSSQMLKAIYLLTRKNVQQIFLVYLQVVTLHRLELQMQSTQWVQVKSC